MENVYVKSLGDAPGATGVGELRYAFVKHAGSAKRERAIDDVGMAGDPSDVRHAPVNIFGMNVLVVLGSAGDVSKIPPGAVLATFGLASGTARVHQEEGIFRIHGNGLDHLVAIVFQNLVHEEIALEDHGRIG